ncbi:MAG: TlpA disulfide reductase family protein [Planctomycetota bacterium]
MAHTLAITLCTFLLPIGVQNDGVSDAQPVNEIPVFRFELVTPGGALPFTKQSTGAVYMSQPPGGPVELRNGDEIIMVDEFANGFPDDPYFNVYDNRIEFPAFAATLHWTYNWENGAGVYSKRRGESIAKVPFTVERVASVHDRFERKHPLDPDAITAIDGRWVVDFANAEDEALGIFEVNDEGLATGTFLTTTGDYRFLEGVVDGSTLKLSCFDGGHAFLFHADLNDDRSLTGDFWSGNWYHDTWTATPAPEGYSMPDAFALTEWTGDDPGIGLDDLVFKDLAGVERSVGKMIEGEPAIIEVFGSWCPNCHDAAKAVKDLQDKYGITVVGLAFELTDEHSRSSRHVRLFQLKHGAEWPILIAGTSDKGEASERLPVFDELRSYPTTLFVRADGTVAALHTGFTGPAAPHEHAELLARWDAIVRDLVEGE